MTEDSENQILKIWSRINMIERRITELLFHLEASNFLGPSWEPSGVRGRCYQKEVVGISNILKKYAPRFETDDAVRVRVYKNTFRVNKVGENRQLFKKDYRHWRELEEYIIID